MEVHEFIHKWKRSSLKESAGSQEHFIDLCNLLNEDTPAKSDGKGDFFTFQKGAAKLDGSKGFADVWRKDCFGWEYKGKHADLKAAYAQLLQYRSNLENPPLLIVSDMKTIQIHTNFTGTVEQVITFELDDLTDGDKLRQLKWIFSDPDKFKPNVTVEEVTQHAAKSLAGLAETLRQRKHNPQDVAHFLSKLIFCMFAEDVELLPEKLIERMVKKSEGKPKEFCEMLRELFAAMKAGGRFGIDKIEFFNGGLFDDDLVIPLEPADLLVLRNASKLNWGRVEPSIFGTLFERGLDPDKRSQLGAHYTPRIDIEKIINPTIVEPLIARWKIIEREVDEYLKETAIPKKRHLMIAQEKTAETKKRRTAEKLVRKFLNEEVRSLRVLDPACGSGNFLYVAMEKLHDIEKMCLIKIGEINLGQIATDITVGPQQIYGIEINKYANELAQVTVWIGHLQWMLKNGYSFKRDPVLSKLNNFLHQNAILDLRKNKAAIPLWPAVDVIIGNPPFLGHHKFKSLLGDEAQVLFDTYKGRLPGRADLVSYWFELAREAIVCGRVKRVGLVATRSIDAGPTNAVLQKIAQDAEIYDVWPNQPWIVEGASVRTAVVCFSAKGANLAKRLNGEPVQGILSDLKEVKKIGPSADHTQARFLKENLNLSFLGTKRNGPFTIPAETALKWLRGPQNINKRSNADVLKPWANSIDIVRRPSNTWIIDFGVDMPKEQAALYEKPFEYVKQTVLPVRQSRPVTKATELKIIEKFWLFQRTCGGFRKATEAVERIIVTPRVSKYRIFAWAPKILIPDDAMFAFTRDDDVFFGILHSRFHEAWSLKNVSNRGKGGQPRYKTTKCFLTFPFPEGLTPNLPASTYKNDPRARSIAAAAKRLDELRQAWLNPEELVSEVEMPGNLPNYFVPKNDQVAGELKKRTLTNLYNASPQWLLDAHEALDNAVASAYGWPKNISNEQAIAKIIKLNQQREAVDELVDEGEEDDDDEPCPL